MLQVELTPTQQHSLQQALTHCETAKMSGHALRLAIGWWLRVSFLNMN
jgi:hypothetical protein